MKIFFATTNPTKVAYLKAIVRNSNIEIICPKDLHMDICCDENGKTVVENALIKARAYVGKVEMPILAIDSALYIDNLAENEQPGLNVRRQQGRYLSDYELPIFYANKMKEIGGESLAHYTNGVALIKDSKEFSTEIIEDKFLMTSNLMNMSHKYNLLDTISIDLFKEKYFCEMTVDEHIQTEKIFIQGMIKFLKDCFKK